MFRAIRANAQASATATEDEVAVEKLLDTIVREERQKGHTLLADQLENITKSKPSNPEPAPLQPLLPSRSSLAKNFATTPSLPLPSKTASAASKKNMLLAID
jgi:hypothetical protein